MTLEASGSDVNESNLALVSQEPSSIPKPIELASPVRYVEV
jgi:hypothetical protein